MSSLGVLGVRPSVSMKNRRYSVYSNYHAYNDLLMDRTLSADYAGDEYLDLPSGALSNKIKKLNRSIIDSSMSLLERLAAIKSFLSDNCQYSLKVENKHKLNPLDNFLFSEKKGHCLLFASAFTLMLREAGIPSRLVNGYAGGAFDSKNKLFVMKSSNAHAWTEVYFARYGWVVVDATPEATNIQPVTASVEDFTEREFKQLSQLDSKGNRLSGSSFFINDTNSFILFLCVSLVLISYFWQFLKRIPALTFLSSKGGKEQKFNPKPEFIILFEKLCTTAGVMVSKSKTPKEMLLEFTHTYEVDDSLNELVDYYYSVRFCGEGREESKEKVWQKLLKVKITQFEKSLALAK
jgi:hypothetical protein